MPRAATHILAWSDKLGAYRMNDGNKGEEKAFTAGASLLSWLDQHGSFSFRGQSGRLSLLKEARKSGDSGYWYAYRRRGTRTVKRYIGRSAEVTIARLEEIAATLNPEHDHPADSIVPQNGPVAADTLLAPKLQPPRLAGSLVRRERLLAQLGGEQKLTIVSAPAGFGKTTLLRQWLAEQDRRGATETVAWVALDPGDNDPLRFWRYVFAACDAMAPGVSAKALDALNTVPTLQPKHQPLETALTALINELTRFGRRGALVLEDYHLITAPQIHESLGFLIDHLPPTLRLIIATRGTPPLALARLRASGELREIDAADLRFSSAETGAFLLGTADEALAPDLLEQVEDRLEGWAAGLRLLALALEGRAARDDIRGTIANFAGNHRSLQEYFAAEVLDSQPTKLQKFLLQTSILTSLNGPLCDFVTESEGGAATLDELDRAQLFLEPMQQVGGWYRYHALFATAMQEEARRRLGAGALQALALRASSWFEQQGKMAHAVEAILSTGDNELLAGLIDKIVVRYRYNVGTLTSVEAPGFHTLRRWLDLLPQEIVRKRPRLMLAYATALLFITLIDSRPLTPAEKAQIEDMLTGAEARFSAEGDSARLGEVYAYRSMKARMRGESTAAVEWAKRALALLPEDEHSWRNVSYTSIALGELTAGRFQVGSQMLQENRALVRASGNAAFVRANLGMLSGAYYEQGRLHLAAEGMRQLLAEAREQHDSSDIGHAQCALAELSYEWNDLATARAQVEEAVAVSPPDFESEVSVGAGLILARLDWLDGDADTATRRITNLLNQLDPQGEHSYYQLYRDIVATRARIALATGDLATARRWANSRDDQTEDETVISRERDDRLLARLLLAEGDPEAALRVLRPMLNKEETASTRPALETRTLMALALAAQQNGGEARQLLGEVLALAHGEGFMRLFLDCGRPMVALLRSLLPSLRSGPLISYARKILHAANAEQAAADDPTATNPALPEPLSAAEVRVLRLLAAGRSNPEIAAELIISVNTVKAHVKSIYRKLDVSNRHEAAEAARQLSHV